ncbi:hypothetical protein D9757_006918 [Collybiopsis confluens]|uniref:nicotinamidase n=1 Tax=Collybiopsis confluens TaxID=2823264 RepID=A0A8H5HJ96_9AGAR|nr:hypothetical protein D9757_006918 [Collybiopsis confluens]
MSVEFKPALLIIDLQEDFCPPIGALAVTDGRSITPIINDLLQLPFVKKVATKDWHPPNHISFAANHPAPNNIPFTSYATIANPNNPNEIQTTRLWPVHCIQGTPNAELIPELDLSRIDTIVDKGKDPRVEMYSAFEAPFRNPLVKEASSGLSQILKEAGVTDVFVTGLAMDYCVQNSAKDAASEGFKTYVISEATKAVDPGPDGWGKTEEELRAAGIKMVSISGEEVEKVRQLAG